MATGLKWYIYIDQNNKKGYISTKTSLTVHTVLCTASIYQTTRSHSSTYLPYVSDTLQYSWIHHIIGPGFSWFFLSFLFFIITQFKCIQNLCRIMFESIFCHTIYANPFFSLLRLDLRGFFLLTKRAGPRFLSINKVQVFWEGYKSSSYIFHFNLTYTAI